ncbi:MAG: recombinase A [bacterium]|nr:recombinase A [bacterium]
MAVDQDIVFDHGEGDHALGQHVSGNLALDVLPQQLLRHPALRRLGETLEPVPAGQPAWSRAELAGRLCELGAGQDGALLSAGLGLVLDAQREGETAAWVTSTRATFFPPDAAACGVDLAALVVVQTKDVGAAGRAADVLLRSGAFGLVVLDLGTGAAMPTPLQGRLVQLALKHDAAVVCLTQKRPDEASLGSLVSLRGQSARRRSRDGRRFVCGIDTLKDKRRGPGWAWQEVRLGPDGLC